MIPRCEVEAFGDIVRDVVVEAWREEAEGAQIDAVVVVAARTAKVGCPRKGGAIVVASERCQLDLEVSRRAGPFAGIGGRWSRVLAVVIGVLRRAGRAAGAWRTWRRGRSVGGSVNWLKSAGWGIGGGRCDGCGDMDDVEFDGVAVAVTFRRWSRP